jgi:ubiquinone/menaquinone biosynthesis C-methylase UbiE
MDSHRDRILDQFTKQASLFQSTHRSAEHAIQDAIRVSGVNIDDVVLDVACGPGVLACAFSKQARHVTGVDVTPQMLSQARELQNALQVHNVDWQLCDVGRMPFEDGAFSMLITRYAFHHFTDPAAVLAEMVRVCAPGGKVVVIDSAPPKEKVAVFNNIEKMRDPSHTQALTREELLEMMSGTGLRIERTYLYAWEVTAESLLARSFPEDGDRDKLMRIYAEDVGVDRLAMNARRIDGVLHVTFPTLIVVGGK